MSQPMQKHWKILIQPSGIINIVYPIEITVLCIAGMCQTIFGERNVIGTLGNDFKCWYANIFLLYYIIISKLCIQTENQEKHETLTLKSWMLLCVPRNLSPSSYILVGNFI